MIITKFINKFGTVTYAEIGSDLTSEDFKVGAHVMINGRFYVVKAHHIEFGLNPAIARMVIIEEV